MIQALVKFNSGVALVLDKSPEFKYYRQGNLIIGLDDTCTFVKCYYYERPSLGFYAFGGREFDIQLDDGDIVHCNGQWWDGGYRQASELLGEELMDVTYNDIPSLNDCYVYYGCFAIKSELEEKINSWDKQIYEYYEYEKFIKGMKNTA